MNDREKSVPKETQIRDAIWGIRRQFSEGCTTRGPCCNDCGSGISARGSGPCLNCYRDRLAKLSTPEIADQFVQATKDVHRIVCDLLD